MSREQVLLDAITNCGTVLEWWKDGWLVERIANAHFDGDIERAEYSLKWGISSVFELSWIRRQLSQRS